MLHQYKHPRNMNTYNRASCMTHIRKYNDHESNKAYPQYKTVEYNQEMLHVTHGL